MTDNAELRQDHVGHAQQHNNLCGSSACSLHLTLENGCRAIGTSFLRPFITIYTTDTTPHALASPNPEGAGEAATAPPETSSALPISGDDSTPARELVAVENPSISQGKAIAIGFLGEKLDLLRECTWRVSAAKI